MARGKKRSTESLIAEIDARIEKKQGEITALKERRKMLEESRSTEIAMQVAKVAEQRGLTLEELLQTVKGV